MPLGRLAIVSALSGTIIAAGLIMGLYSSIGNVVSSNNPDFSLIRSAEADSTNSLFLKIDGMPGSSADTKHKDQIELLWYCFGFSSRTDMRGCNSEEGKNTFDKTNFDGFHFIMADNKATPKLMAAYLSNSTIDTVTFYAQKGTMYDGRDYLTVTLSDVKLTSYFHASNDKYSVPVVEVSMTFSKIHMEYNDGSAPVTAGWDFKTNTPF